MNENRIHDTLQSLHKQKDLLSFVDELEIFVNLLEDCDKKKIWLDKFYGDLAMFAHMSDPNFIFADRKERYIISDRKAVHVFMNARMPHYQGPKKTLKALKAFISEMRSTFTLPIGERIEEETIIEILDYLDQKYDFTSKVLNSQSVFTLINNSHTERNAEYFNFQTRNGLSHNFCLYHMVAEQSDEEKTSLNPVYIFFHELGHALFLKFSNNTMEIPAILLDTHDTIAPGFKNYPLLDQLEVIADTFAVGLMHDSPFASFDPFPFDMELKNFFHTIVKKVVEH